MTTQHWPVDTGQCLAVRMLLLLKLRVYSVKIVLEILV